MAASRKARTYAMALAWVILFPMALVGIGAAIGDIGVIFPILFLLVLAWLVPPIQLIRRRRSSGQ